jgi:hypothetical protein
MPRDKLGEGRLVAHHGLHSAILDDIVTMPPGSARGPVITRLRIHPTGAGIHRASIQVIIQAVIRSSHETGEDRGLKDRLSDTSGQSRMARVVVMDRNRAIAQIVLPRPAGVGCSSQSSFPRSAIGLAPAQAGQFRRPSSCWRSGGTVERLRRLLGPSPRCPR